MPPNDTQPERAKTQQRRRRRHRDRDLRESLVEFEDAGALVGIREDSDVLSYEDLGLRRERGRIAQHFGRSQSIEETELDALDAEIIQAGGGADRLGDPGAVVARQGDDGLSYCERIVFDQVGAERADPKTEAQIDERGR